MSNEDHQSHLIDRAIIYARDGKHDFITAEMVDAILADRQLLLDAMAVTHQPSIEIGGF